jgi:hypothetical protein
MTDDAPERWIGSRADGPESARRSDDDSAESDPELRLVVDLVRGAALENGIDLAPRWTRYLADQLDKSAKSVSKRRTRNWAARLTVAAALGGGLVAGVAAAPLMRLQTARAPNSIGQPHYSTRQLNRMFALLSDAPPDETTIREAAAELTGCLACHAPAMRSRIGSAIP